MLAACRRSLIKKTIEKREKKNARSLPIHGRATKSATIIEYFVSVLLQRLSHVHIFVFIPNPVIKEEIVL